MLIRTTQGYFSEGRSLIEILGAEEAVLLTQYLDLMFDFSEPAVQLIRDRAIDVCALQQALSNHLGGEAEL